MQDYVCFYFVKKKSYISRTHLMKDASFLQVRSNGRSLRHHNTPEYKVDVNARRLLRQSPANLPLGTHCHWSWSTCKNKRVADLALPPGQVHLNPRIEPAEAVCRHPTNTQYLPTELRAKTYAPSRYSVSFPLIRAQCFRQR